MNEQETQQIVARLSARAAANGRRNGSDQALQNALQTMVQAGAARLGMRADAPHRNGGLTACDLAPPLARLIDHTALKPETTEADIEKLCDEARRFCFASVCINPSFVPLATSRLGGTPIAVCTVIGFPLGATYTAVKAAEAELAVGDGAAEVDMVLNVGMLKSGRYDFVEKDIRAVVEAARSSRRSGGRALVKVILETALLSDEEKVIACVLAQNAGADFVKTSTGFSTAGATASDVALMHRAVGGKLGVKASGGVRSLEDAETMIAHGATRIGASASVAIVQGLKGESGY